MTVSSGSAIKIVDILRDFYNSASVWASPTSASLMSSSVSLNDRSKALRHRYKAGDRP